MWKKKSDTPHSYFYTHLLIDESVICPLGEHFYIVKKQLTFIKIIENEV